MKKKDFKYSFALSATQAALTVTILLIVIIVILNQWGVA